MPPAAARTRPWFVCLQGLAYAVESQIVEYPQTFRHIRGKILRAVDSSSNLSTIEMWKIGIKSSYAQSYPHYPQIFIQIIQIYISFFETKVL